MTKPTYEEVRDLAYAALKSRGVEPLTADQATWAKACDQATRYLTWLNEQPEEVQ